MSHSQMERPGASRPGVEGDPRTSLFAAAFQVLPDSAVILDAEGVIVAANDEWYRFAAENGGPPDGHVGASYLGACGRETALERALEAVLRGEVDQVRHEYPCHSPTERRFFLMQATSFVHGRRRYALVRHVNITERRLMEERALERAAHDDLTGLPTRAAFTERLEQSLARASRYRQRVAVLMLDLDGFKAINDTHGHPAGDRALEIVSERLTETVRAVDALSRAGGDEFLLMAEEADEAGVLRLTERIHDQLSRPMAIDGEVCVVGASIGIAFYPDHGRSVDALVAHADAAMYEAKAAGKNRAVIYEPDRHAA